MNLLELYESTKKFSLRRADYAQNYSWAIESIVPYVGTKSLLVQATCHGLTQHGVKHITNIMFSGVEFHEEPVDGAELKELVYKGEKYYYKRPDLHTQCTVRCSCLDFYFTWMWPDKSAKALFGNLGRPYKRKTTTRPPRNPDHIPGFCKHVFQLESYLRNEDWIA